MTRSVHSPAPVEPGSQKDWLDLVQHQVESLRYGIVQIVVHEGQVVQIEKTERLRLDSRSQTVTRSRQSGELNSA
jgi:hypothetical protein